MSPLAPLLAQGLDDLLKIAIAILFVVIPVVWGILSKLGQQQGPGGGPARRPPGGPGQARRPPAGAPQARGPARGGLEDEIGEFLRRAARQRQAQPARPPRPAERPVMAQPVEVEVVREAPLGDQMKRHVREYLNTGDFERRTSELGDEVAQADDQMEQRLHEKFDHELGRLAATPGQSAGQPQVEEAAEPEGRVAELPSTAAAGLAVMLSQPIGIRQAIIINEILARPEHRWT